MKVLQVIMFGGGGIRSRFQITKDILLVESSAAAIKVIKSNSIYGLTTKRGP